MDGDCLHKLPEHFFWTQGEKFVDGGYTHSKWTGFIIENNKPNAILEKGEE